VADELPKRKKRKVPLDQSPPPHPPSTSTIKKILEALKKKKGES
jgi:hypothetical protein